MNKTGILSAFLLLTAPCAGIAAGEGAAQQEAAGYYGAGRTSKALETCIAALNSDPSDEKLYVYALEILPEGPSTYAGPLRAITAKASALKPGAHIYYLGLCKLNRGAGRLPEALSNCKKARELDPTHWAVYRELGLTYSKSGDRGRAVETLALGAELSPADYRAYYYLAAEHERRREFPAALRNYRRALALQKTAKGPGARIDAGLIRNAVDRLADLPAKKPAAPKPAAAAPVKLFEACMREAEELRKADNPGDMEKKLAACAALAPRDPQVRTDRAGFLMRLGKYEDAIAQYQAAAGLFPGNDPMAAFCHLKTAQIYAKINDTAKADLYYRKALEINKNDLNAMLGLAAACEARGDLKTAGELYARVLKAEPANAKAGERLEEINFGLLSDAQLLEELRARGAADDKKTALSDDDRKLLRDMRRAESNGAVDYLKARTSNTRGLIVERPGPNHVRLLLTLTGLKNYQTYQSRAAVGFFEKKGINLRDVFALRDLNGAPIFAAGGRLTAEGMETYWGAQAGEKTWIMPYESPKTPENERANAAIARMIGQGFSEFSESEYLWLMKVTTCPDDVLQADPCNIKMLEAGEKTRKYFLCADRPMCGTTPATQASQILATYIAKARAGEQDVVNAADTHSGFFGVAGPQKRRFCHNGKVWTGD